VSDLHLIVDRPRLATSANGPLLYVNRQLNQWGTVNT
jgi:hypothetical protein